MINIAVFVLLIIVLYDSWPIDTEKSRALLACCIIGFIFTQLIIIGRMSARYISLLPDVIIGLFMVIFNIVAGTIALEESKPLYDTTSTVGVKSFRSIRNYLTAGVNIQCLYKSSNVHINIIIIIVFKKFSRL